MDQPTQIIAIVTTQKENIAGGGVPVFITRNHKQLQDMSFSLEKILDASAQEVDEQTIILVAH